MTICIAGIGSCKELGNKKEAVVFATDHMITFSNLGQQFEHSIEKYRRINSNTVVMLSGETLLFESAIKGIGEKDNFDNMVKQIHHNMINMRDARVRKLVLAKFQIGFKDVKDFLKLEEHNQTTEEILDAIKQISLGTSLMLVGFKDAKAQLVEINEHAYVNARDIHFNAIGSGGAQALNTLLFQRHSSKEDLKTTVYNVFKAKRNSEVSRGVGKETDIFIMTADGKILKVGNEQIKILDEIYKKEMKYGKKQKELSDMIAQLIGEKNA